MEKVPPNSYIILLPLTDQKDVRMGGGLTCALPFTLTQFYPHWKPNAAQIDVRVLSCIFLKNRTIAALLLRHFGLIQLRKIPRAWNRNLSLR